MENTSLIKRILPHFIVIILFIIISLIYVYPVFEGKTLAQTDVVQAKAAAQEAKKYYEETGKLALWTNSMFGGMPGYLVFNPYPYSVATYIGRFFSNFLPTPASMIFLYMAGCYILLMVLGCSPWLGALGAIGFAFGSYNMINIEAGHLSKVLAVAYAPPIIAGFILAYRGKYLLAAIVTAFFMALELYANHVQITYYLFIALGIYVIFKLVEAIREKKIKQFITASVVLGVAGIVGVGTHTSRLLPIAEYTTQSIRGKSDLTQKGQASDGADKDYAFNWSYGKIEAFTLLIPELYGGSSQGNLGPKSETYQTLVGRGVAPNQATQFVSQLPTYWGDQPFTSGPAYAGAIILFLFVLGLLLVRGPLKWWLIVSTVLLVLFALGKNFDWFNTLFFNYFPLFNRFRAVTMTLSLVQIFIVVLAVLGLKQLVKGEINKEEPKKSLFISFGITGGLALLFWLFSGVFMDFQASTDPQLAANLTQMTGEQSFANAIMQSLQDDRQSLLRSDALRSFIFILLAFGLLWLYTYGKLKLTLLYTGLIVLVLADMFAVDKRYFNSENFVSKNRLDDMFRPTAADLQILQDKDPHYRVLNLATSPLQDARPSYFHKSVGGYHGAKLRRYQELFENQIAKNNMRVLNMLNTKYFIAPGQNGQPAVQRNPDALGNAWFVEGYKTVENADQELASLDTLNPAETAVVDKRFANHLQGLTIQPDPASNIKLTEYKPDYLKYESQVSTPQLALFSEIYYNEFDDWRVLIDGKEADHFRANYVLRAMVVPTGKHTIEFLFEPKLYNKARIVDLISSIVLVAGIAIVGFIQFRKK